VIPDQQPATHNQPEFSVSQISQALKRTVEDAFSFVRIRGEISGLKKAASGHIYLSLKDDKSVLNTICWKGIATRLSFAPEDGMEVICTGKISTYPGRSGYQLIIDSMEIAGAGALMALLEKRRKQLEKEGLFSQDRKKQLPYLPQTIGVITSPTGAVIRDILHRISDRFPVHILLWPVLVQGEGAANQISAAIDGFNTLPDTGGVARPDLLIVARGGGSLEDLWAFNEEVVVRSTANSVIPIISAVGHETDTTLIDYAADKRAPTPTAAAEIAVPVRAELLATIYDHEKRLLTGIHRKLNDRQQYLTALSRGITSPQTLLNTMIQRLDDWSERLSESLPRLVERKGKELLTITPRLTPRTLVIQKERMEQKLQARGNLRPQAILQRIELLSQTLTTNAKLLESYHYKKVLSRGFALIRTDDNNVVTKAKSITKNMPLVLEFADGKISAIANASAGNTIQKKKTTKPNITPPTKDENQGSLF